MRLITFTPKTAPTSAPRVGALLPGNRSVLNFAVAVDASADVPLLTWFDLDDEWLPKAKQIHDALAKSAERVETLPRGSVVPAADVLIGPPVPRPGKIICIGLNYKDHAAESNMPVPTSPITFSKYVTSVTGPGQPIALRYPEVGQRDLRLPYRPQRPRRGELRAREPRLASTRTPSNARPARAGRVTPEGQRPRRSGAAAVCELLVRTSSCRYPSGLPDVAGRLPASPVTLERGTVHDLDPGGRRHRPFVRRLDLSIRMATFG